MNRPLADSSGAAALEVRQAQVRFGGLLALDEVSLVAHQGQVLGLVGPNGAGKSTLFAVCSGLVTPNRGQVLLGGRDVTTLAPHRRVRLGLGRTFQLPQLFAGLTVRQHLILAHRVRRHPGRLWRDMFDAGALRSGTSHERQVVTELLELLDLTACAEEPVDGMPLGLCRLVEVGRALAAEPTVVLLDEPFSGLDSRETDRLADALARTVDRAEVALVLVEHDVGLVARLAHHMVVLDFGKVIAAGEPGAVCQDPTVQAAYLGVEQTSGDQASVASPSGSAGPSGAGPDRQPAEAPAARPHQS